MHELLYMRPSCEGMTCYTREDFFADPSHLLRITYPQDMALLQCHRREVDKDEDGALEYRIVHRNGSVRWIEHGCHPVHNANGQFRGRRLSNRDVTERKRAVQTCSSVRRQAQNH